MPRQASARGGVPRALRWGGSPEAGNVLVTLAQHSKRDCVDLAFTVARAETAVAFLDYADLRRLRDHVDEALDAMNPA
ncbi:hypothetical protein GCM10010532_097880 [Dactylosporangium siamense]|uniref:Uncharacterized protein n=1 Tax=Dactylosporangium siamense TaxID=685454 RepID=A0A919UJY0_9ACTN|nr:hypothetical protein Dsi01nite_111990 [Dactylosporangium siamense]